MGRSPRRCGYKRAGLGVAQGRRHLEKVAGWGGFLPALLSPAGSRGPAAARCIDTGLCGARSGGLPGGGCEGLQAPGGHGSMAP